MDDAKQQLADKIKSANNVLVTVSRDPSVDQLSALLGLTLLLNKQGKHAAAVFSGQVPSTIEFLEPEETIEKNTDSLRDFIIALDKNKADKLRYKVEDDVVRIFITPYKTSISQEDFEFSQGDFNVDVVVALGVQQQEDLDDAITAHGRILHDATVTSINTSAEGGLGSINWDDASASSLSELVTEMTQLLGPDLLDEQIATALLTGIVSETDRFSNDKTSPNTMSMSAILMGAGANQQLVASKLEEPPEAQDDQETSGEDNPDMPEDSDDPSAGMIEIDHEPGEEPAAADDESAGMELPEPDAEAAENAKAEVEIPDEVKEAEEAVAEAAEAAPEEPVAPETPEAEEKPLITPDVNVVNGPPPTPPVSVPPATPLTDNKPPETEQPPVSGVPEIKPSEPASGFTPPPADWTPPSGSTPVPASPPPAPAAPSPAPTAASDSAPADAASDTGLSQVMIDPNDGTLKALEQSLAAPQPAAADVTPDSARDEVNRAINAASAPPQPPKPIASLNAQPLGDNLHPAEPPVQEPNPSQDNAPDATASPQPSAEPTFSPFSNVPADDPSQPATGPQVTDSTAPPPVPPPIPFQFGKPPEQQ
jgi:nanoRNase/pAp phosphatase (c-di-AMP/oligoRNAs hydrolase)